MSFEPTLRLRRKQPHVLANLTAIAICMVWTVTIMAWGLMPGPAPTPDAPGVDVVNTAKKCDPTVILPSCP